MKVLLPNNWQSVSIKQFIDLSKLNREGLDDFDLSIEILSIMSELPRQELAKIKAVDITKLWRSLSFLEELSFDDQIPPIITIEGVKYKANLDVSKMTADQYMCFKNLMKTGDVIGNIHNIMATFYIPEGKKYNNVPIHEVSGAFYNHLSIAVAYPISVFFCRLSLEWMNHLRTCLDDQVLKTMQKVSELLPRTSLKSGVGS